MHEYLYDVTIVRLAIIVGVVVTTLFYERVQLTTGGAIVPGYLALFTRTPLYILVTLLIAYLTFHLVNNVLTKRYILYGRRKFEMEILIALTLLTLSVGTAHLVVRFSPLLLALYGIGFVIPAIIAHDMPRQGPRKTLIAVLINTAIVACFIYVFSALSTIAPGRATPEVAHLASLGGGEHGYPADLLLVAVFTSVICGMVVFWKLGLRSGGFVTGAYLALMLLRPLDLLFAAAVAVVSYRFVTGVLMRHILVFGRRKLSMMVLTAAIIAWTAELVITAATGGAYRPWSGLHVITLIVPALLANDLQRQGLYRTFWGAGLTTVGVFAITNLVDAVRLMIP